MPAAGVIALLAGAAEADKLLRQFCLLKSCGLESELVFLSDEQGEYLRPRLREIEGRLASFGLAALLGVKGGVLCAPTAAEADCRRAVRAAPTRMPITGWLIRVSRSRNQGWSLRELTAPDMVLMPNINMAKPIRMLPM